MMPLSSWRTCKIRPGTAPPPALHMMASVPISPNLCPGSVRRVNEVDSTGWTPLHWAASRGRERMVKFLLENKADATIVTEDSWSPVHDAARVGSCACLRMLQQAGANMILPTGNGSTPLHYAAQYDRTDAVVYLLNDAGPDSTLRDVANHMGQVCTCCVC